MGFKLTFLICIIYTKSVKFDHFRSIKFEKQMKKIKFGRKGQKLVKKDQKLVKKIKSWSNKDQKDQ